MKIKEIYRQDRPVISFEIFPPKKDSPIETIYRTLDKLKNLSPDFISVTYGAGGSSRDRTAEISGRLKQDYRIEPLSHLTGIASSAEEIMRTAEELDSMGVRNILALRGDYPAGTVAADYEGRTDFRYATDLIGFLREKYDFSLGAACYPEGHMESKSVSDDITYMKQKQDLGADFFVTQIFFDNNYFYDMKDKAEAAGVTAPVSAGIMPVTNKKQIERITSLCGTSIPDKFRRMMDRFEHNEEALREAGIAYAAEQMIDLLSSGVDGLHIYTMNKPDVVHRLCGNISVIREVLSRTGE